MKQFSTILMVLFLVTTTNAATINDYEFSGLTWGSSVATLKEQFPNAAVDWDLFDPNKVQRDKALGLEHYILYRFDVQTIKKSEIGEAMTVQLGYYQDHLYEFKLTYQTEHTDWEALLARLTKRFGEPEKGITSGKLTSISRWNFPSEMKTVFFIPPQTESDQFIHVEIRDNALAARVPTPQPEKRPEGF